MNYTLNMERDKELLFMIEKMFQNFEEVGLDEFKSLTSLVSINILLGKICLSYFTSKGWLLLWKFRDLCRLHIVQYFKPLNEMLVSYL